MDESPDISDEGDVALPKVASWALSVLSDIWGFDNDDNIAVLLTFPMLSSVPEGT